MPIPASVFSPRRRTLLCWPAALALPGMAAAQVETLAIVGKDNYIFAGWGNSGPPDDKGIDATVARMAEVRRLLAARGTTLVVPVLPDKMSFHEDKLPEGKAITAETRARYAGILGRMQAADIPTFDGAATLRAVQAAGQPVYYKTDQHWTQAGADAMAQGTADVIRRLVPTLAGAPGTGLALGTVSNERRFGDLAERFLTPEQRRAVGRETFTVRRTSESDNLLGDALAPVHVTGNSMVQPYFGYPQKLSNLIDRPVTVNWKPGDVGFWIVLLDYIESAGFRKQPPQVLVWQLFEPNFHLGPEARGLWDAASIVTESDWSRRVKAALA